MHAKKRGVERNLKQSVADCILCLAAILALAGSSGSAEAADLSWSGTVEILPTNEAGAIYGSSVAGVTPFTGYVVYPDACGGCLVEPFPPDSTNYVFLSGAGGLMGAGASSVAIESSVEITDEELITQDIVDLGAALGFAIPLGQTLDSWTAGNETAGEFGPDFVEWSISYVYWTTDPFSNTSYTPTPPPNPDAIIFETNQFAGDLFEAIGLVSSVPEPGFGILMGAGSVALLLGSKKRSAVRAPTL